MTQASEYIRRSGFYKCRPVTIWQNKDGSEYVDESSRIAIDQMGRCAVCDAECYSDGIDSDGIVKHFCERHHPLVELTTLEAAETVGLTRKAIIQAIARDKLRAVKFGRDWVVLRGDLMDWLASPRKVGRPVRKSE